MAWNGSDNKEKVDTLHSTPTPITYTYKRGALAGLAVVALGCAALYYFTRHTEQPTKQPTKQPTTPTAIAEVAPAIVTNRPVQVAKKESSDKKDAEPSAWRAWLLKKAEKDPQLMFHLTNKVVNAVVPTFPSSVEQAMDWIFNCTPGDDPLPLPDLSDEDPTVIAQALISINEIKDDDDEDVANRKDMVMLAKKELRQFIKDGGDYAQFMEYYRGQLVKYHEMWIDAQDSIEHAPEELSHEQMTTLVEKTNAMLSEKGIKPIELNDNVRERMGLPLNGEEEENEQSQKENQ